MRSCVIIPARFKSSRFKGKPLALIMGKPMILWVTELSAVAVGKKNVFVATDDNRIKHTLEAAGFNVIMTKPENLTGTDRVAEASTQLDYDIYINVQGDEPLANPKDILKAIEIKKNNMKYVINSFSYLNDDDNPDSKNIPKVVTDENNNLIFISRSKVPSSKLESTNYKYKKQVCIYAYDQQQLDKFSSFGRKSIIEKQEDIEILRFFELNIPVMMFESSTKTIAVDFPEDIKKVEKFMKNKC